MLMNAEVRPTLPVADLKRARKFYEETLGLKVVHEDATPGVAFSAGNGTVIYLYQAKTGKVDHTEAAFSVRDVEAEVRELKAKGVKFIDLDAPSMGLKTVNGIATRNGFKGAWFKDSEGNVIALSQHSG